MIDYIALAIGHGLMAIALLRLVMRKGLDDDPLIGALKAEAQGNRLANSSAGRRAARQAGLDGDENDPRSNGDGVAHHPRSSSDAVAHKTPRSSSEAVAHKATRSSSEAVAHKNA